MDNKNTLLWSLSLIVITLVTLIWVISSFAGIKLPDTVIRILGILDICAIPVLVFTSIRKRNGK